MGFLLVYSSVLVLRLCNISQGQGIESKACVVVLNCELKMSSHGCDQMHIKLCNLRCLSAFTATIQTITGQSEDAEVA